MMPRPNWKGFLKLSLVSVPVTSYSAVSSTEGEIHFHQLHASCRSRIKYVKTCPIHGAVPADEIVSGYEFAKGEYVVIQKEELTEQFLKEEKSIDIQSIIATSALDPIYLTEQSAYLLPEGGIARKPYAVIEQCLREQNRIALGKRIVNGRDSLVAVRPVGKLLVMTTLSNAVQVKASDEYEAQLTDVEVTPSELKLTRTLFEAFYSNTVDLAEFKDEYNNRMSELIEDKLKGHKRTSTRKLDQPDVINLMDALKKSLAAAKPQSTARSRNAKSAKSEPSMAQLKRSAIAAKRKSAKRA
ncbi:non-homologous end joining protein Ku [Schlesneria paludicola]|uniref:non-homologous end joining protein Ku n=1 Tax=Schlesneria paludicola TaxID=360056 RepID=UPI0002EB5588|nr:Ku protein [Schlesneria paludicola]